MKPTIRDDHPIVTLFNDELPAPLTEATTVGGVVTTFVGHSFLGTKTTDKGWRIAKIVETTVGGVVTTVTEYADGDREFDNVWDDRATLRYSR